MVTIALDFHHPLSKLSLIRQHRKSMGRSAYFYEKKMQLKQKTLVLTPWFEPS
jgi:hypothetical protein